MKFLIVASGLSAMTLLASADTLRLTTGKIHNGAVISYANMTFEVQDEKGVITRLPAPSVVSIDFSKGAVETTLETRTAGKLQRKVSLYDKGAFSVQDEKGEVQKVPAMMVTSATFGGGGGGSASGKKVDNVGGTDLTKHIVNGKVTIIDFYADWCGPCRMISPVLEDIAKKDPDVYLRKVNVDKNQTLARKFNVRGIPHIMVYNKAGKNTATIVGADKAGVQRAVDQAKTGS